MTTIQAIATFENDTLTIISQPESGEVRRILKFTDAGIDMVMLSMINYVIYFDLVLFLDDACCKTKCIWKKNI